MGPNPVQFQILSDQAQNFRSAISKTVNYEDPYSCVDLPIFSIHGNHDDPTRDGGTEMLAALDLLAVNHLVNYFGRHDEVDKVQVSPVLIKKGDTKVALYGMGSMRDERLNRMWQGKKVRFLRPHPEDKDNDNDNDSNSEDEDSDDGENNGGWFNIFALHQNRDLGRGSKNCVHESMIPEWMDLVVWGHEHECLIDPSESAVGTYRITQPGSSVATSLSEGESMRKHVGILDVRGSQFRMTAVPLMQVRAFATGQISLGESNLDADDPRIDEAMKELLAEEVEKLAEQAREDSRLLQNDAKAVAGASENGTGDNDLTKHLHFHVKEPNQVLVRLKVEHSGFTTLHNQRFGSQFVNHVVSADTRMLCGDGQSCDSIRFDSNFSIHIEHSFKIGEPVRYFTLSPPSYLGWFQVRQEEKGQI
jgi:double-strand break repair protein MRE11